MLISGFYARRHDEEKAKRSMRRLYGNVPGYDESVEFQVLRENVAHFEALHSLQKSSTIKEIFSGING